jgi:uncharacterized GH25 family protein
MFKKGLLALLLLVILCGHDMYLKTDTYFFSPNTEASIQLLNGTFEKSDNIITRDRMLDVSLVGLGERIAVDTAKWSDVGQTTLLSFKTGAPGTWVAGVSTAPRTIEMSATDFNEYLQHDGVLDMLEWRTQNNALDQDAVEKYSKHVKAIFQVGEQLSDDWKTVLGYPIEFIPLVNPYDIHQGHEMEVQLLVDGQPLANQLVYVGSEAKAHEHEDEQDHSHEEGEHMHEHSDAHSHDHDHEHSNDHDHQHAHEEEHTHTHSHENGHSHSHEHEHQESEEETVDHHHILDSYRTDAEGKIRFKVAHQGIWYVRTIHLVQTEEEGLTHESN